jgi:hypothetical protein
MFKRIDHVEIVTDLGRLEGGARVSAYSFQLPSVACGF